jgi:hypothetical protein
VNQYQKAILYLADELFHLLTSVSSIEPLFERCFSHYTTVSPEFRAEDHNQSASVSFLVESRECSCVKEPPQQSSIIPTCVIGEYNSSPSDAAHSLSVFSGTIPSFSEMLVANHGQIKDQYL